MLAAAGVGHTLGVAQVPYLVIKGAVADLRGIRPQKFSADLDVLVHPTHVDAALGALAGWGWRPEATMAGTQEVAGHAVTLSHHAWPLAIDLHGRFPGFTEGPERAFDALWERRETLAAAGARCAAPDMLGALLIEGLNALRSVASDPARRGEIPALERLIDGLPADQRADLDRLVERAGAGFAWRAIGAGDHAGDHADGPANAEELEWAVRIGGGGTLVSQAVAALYVGRGGSRWRLIGRLLWPRTDQLLAAYGSDDRSWPAVVRLRWVRLWRGLSQVPAALARTRRASRAQ